MLRELEEYGKYVEITGFRKISIGDAKALMNAVCKDLTGDVEVQLFDADLVATWQHLYFAALNALMAFKNKRNISKSLAVETALYASSQRQIKKAIEQIGVKPGSANIAAMVIGADETAVKAGLSVVAKRVGAEPDETVLELSKTKAQHIRTAFGVSDAELKATSSKDDAAQALVDLIIEHVALLSTRL